MKRITVAAAAILGAVILAFNTSGAKASNNGDGGGGGCYGQYCCGIGPGSVPNGYKIFVNGYWLWCNAAGYWSYVP